MTNPPLGSAETGGQAALPIWISYMAKSTQRYSGHSASIPEGVVVQQSDYGFGPVNEFYYQRIHPHQPRTAA